MRLIRLATAGFRNLHAGELRTDAQFVLLVGPNAQGKTNTLEAIYVLATLRPLRARRTAELIAWGGTEAGIAGDVRSEVGVHKHRVDFGPQGRRVSLDGERTELGPYFEGIRVVAFTPADGDIVLGEPKGRRAWLDRAAFTRAPAHLDVVRTYRRTLAQKSALLKDSRVDRQVSRCSITSSPAKAPASRTAGPRWSLSSGPTCGPCTRPLPDPTSTSGSATGPRRRATRSTSGRPRSPSRSPSTARTSNGGGWSWWAPSATTSGCTRGQGHPVVRIARPGAEPRAGAEARRAGGGPRAGQGALFLLDDVSSELDRQRTRRLVGLLSELGTQVFATTTDPDHVEGLPDSDTLRFAVQDGVLS